MSKKVIKSSTLLQNMQKPNANKAFGFSVNGINSSANYNNRFKHIKMFKKKEIIQPYLHPTDAIFIQGRTYEFVRKELVLYGSSYEEMQDMYNLLPKHLINDIYSLYYNRGNKMKFEKIDETNKVKFEILKSINNSLIKIVSNDSHLTSGMYTQEICKFLYSKYRSLSKNEQKDIKNALKNCNQEKKEEKEKKEDKLSQNPSIEESDSASTPQNPSPEESSSTDTSNTTPDNVSNNNSSSSPGKGDSSNLDKDREISEEHLKTLNEGIQKFLQNLNSPESQKSLQDSLDKVSGKVEKLRNLGIDIDEANKKSLQETSEIFNSLDKLNILKKTLENLNVNKVEILKVVNKILNNSKNYFSLKCTEKNVEIFEADEILNIEGLEFLHPAFRKSRIFDLNVIEKKYVGKIDLYIDCSGSMSSKCPGELSEISAIDLAKALALKMKEVGILENYYEFEMKVRPKSSSLFSILESAPGGGTSLDSVIGSVKKTGNNSIILTDAEDYVNTYSEKVLFIGVNTHFKMFRNETGLKYLDNKQCFYYNGKTFVTPK